MITFNWTPPKNNYQNCKKGTYELYITGCDGGVIQGFIYEYYDTLIWNQEFFCILDAKTATEVKFLEIWESTKKEIEQ